MYNYLVKEFVTYCKNGCVIQQDILLTETGNGPFPYTHPSPAPPALYFMFSFWCLVCSEKHLGSLWWPFQCFYMSNLTAEVLVMWRKMFG